MMTSKGEDRRYPTVSPYLRRPCRSLEEVLRAKRGHHGELAKIRSDKGNPKAQHDD